MVQIKLNDKYYILPMGDVYKDNFSNCLFGDLIDFSWLDLEERYRKVDELFGFVSRSFVVAFADMEEDGLDSKYAPEIANICQKIDSLDRRQKFIYEHGNIERSIQIILGFIEEMLILKDKILDEEKVMRVG